MIKGFITNLGKYAEGHLIGVWIAFPIYGEELKTVLDWIGINEKYEEYFFADWDCNFDTGLGEYETIDHVNQLAEDLETEDEELIEAIIEATGYNLRDAMDHVDRATFYKGETLEGLAYEFVGEIELPEIARIYFDYEAYARDLQYNGYTGVTNGVICMH